MHQELNSFCSHTQPGILNADDGASAVTIESCLELKQNTWIGFQPNALWSTNTNWSLGIVPTLDHNVFIPSNKVCFIPSNFSAVCNQIDVQPNSLFVVNGELEVVVDH